MATDDLENNPSARRLRLRRTARGFTGGGSSGSTRSESLRDSSYEDEVDAAIDPEAVHAHIQRRAQTPPPTPPRPADDPARRLVEVAQSGSSAYAKEYRMQLLHRLLLRNIPLDQIATQLRVSISTVEKDRVALKKQLRENARELHIDEMIGNQTGFYEEVAGMAMRIASDAGRTDQSTGLVVGGVPVPMRLAGLRTALAANADKTRFYQNAGVYDVLRFRRSEDGSGMSDIQLLMERTAQMLSNLSDNTGFAAFSSADPQDPEVMDI